MPPFRFLSTIGYTPDVFVPLLSGVMFDVFPDGAGYRYFFLIISAICCTGLLASLTIYLKFVRKQGPGPSLMGQVS